MVLFQHHHRVNGLLDPPDISSCRHVCQVLICTADNDSVTEL